MSQNIKNLFANKYNPNDWKAVLKTIFKNKVADFYLTPQNRKREDLKAHDITQSILELGNIVLDDNSRILFYEVKLIESKQVSSKVILRDIISSEIIPGNEDGIIATFYNPISKDWRLTFVSKSRYWDEDFNQIKIETQPKRYTFLLGQGESIKTALNQFDWLLQEIKNKEITIEHLLKTFSVQKITNDFFRNYFHHFKLLVGYISDNPDAFSFFKIQVDNNKTNKEQQDDAEKLVRQFVKKLMGRIVFLYFLQKKGWLGVPENESWGNGEKDFMSRLFASFDNKNDFYYQCLAPLFFQTLNKDRKESNDIFEITNTRIPYLNGGLFDKDQIEPLEIKIIPERFDELFQFFDQYNFTIDENSPDDQDIGIDPEMLGLIFENLLEDNKDKGTFYTPKEVVHFMCKESISQYIADILQKTTTEKELKEIAIYIKQSSNRIDLDIIKKFAEAIDKALTDCKICDPAIGSGAFPMGMVFEMMRLKKELHAFYKQDDFIYHKQKLSIIKNNIYGVDLDKGAVDIARLRFWLSLIVDEKEPKPLPNLDYKIMQGNSLVESFEGIQLDKITADGVKIFGQPKQMTFGEEFDKPQKEIEFTVAEKIELKQWVENYFSVDKLTDKQELHRKIDNAVLNHLDKNTELFEKSALRQVAEIEDKYEKAGKNIADYPSGKDYKTWFTLKTKSETTRNKLQQIQESSERPYFLWHLFFGNVLNEGKKGFDIVIGNPPYGGMKIDDKTQEEYNLASKDPYGAFMSMAINKLLKPNGTLCYIVSDTWLTIKSHKPLREQVLQYDLKNVIRLHKDCFNATVNSCIFTLKKTVVKQSSEVSHLGVRGLIAADLTNISTRKQIPEFREKLFHLEDYVGQYTPDFAVYEYAQSLLKTNNNLPVLVASPKLFQFMNDNGHIETNIYFINFNSKKIEIEKVKKNEDVKKGMDSDIKFVYRADESVQIIRTKYKIVNKDSIRNDKEILNLSKDEKLNGIKSDNFIIPFNKGGSSSTKEDWLPNYFVDVEYYIDFSEVAVKKHYHRNKSFYFNEGLTFSFRGDYSPTFRLKNIGPFDANSSFLSSDKHDKSVFIGILNSKLVRYIFNAIIQHTVASDIDKIKEIPIVVVDKLNSIKIKLLVETLIEKQKKYSKYNYFANEQKEIDLLVYELYGLNEDDINEVETWFARRYPKLAKYAYYKTQKELTEAQLAQDTTNQKLLELIAKGESKTVEFKSTLRYCLRQKNPQKYVEHSAIKNLAAFLNSEGGTLFIGVDDDGTILGLEQTDFASFKAVNKKDEFVKHFDNLVQNYFGNDKVHKFKVEFETIKGKTIALIHIKDKATSPVMITNPEKNNEQEFYVRRNASAIGLTMYEMYNYCKEVWD